MSDVLIIAGRLPYPTDDGWKLRTYHVLNALAAAGYTVDLVAFGEPETSCPPELARLCREVVVVPRIRAYATGDLLRGVLFSVPFSVLNYRDAAFALAVDGLVRRHTYAFVQVEDIVMAQYAAPLSGMRRYLDMHNVESDLMARFADQCRQYPKRLYAAMTSAKLRRYEVAMAPNFNAIFVCSEDDAALLGSMGVSTPVKVVPNGVDSAAYAAEDTPREQALVFVGSMNYHANISGIEYFHARILPLLRKRHPDLKVYIVGKTPPPSILAMQSDHVVVTGAVDDVRPYLHRAQISVVPLLVGGGTRLKILEAMAAGLPVVSTTLGAEGIQAVHGKELCLADTAQDFADQVSFLLEHPQERARMAQAAQAMVRRAYDWSVVGRLLHEAVLRHGGEPGETLPETGGAA